MTQTTAQHVEAVGTTVSIEVTTPVAAPADAAWAVLTDTAAYPEWNPFVERLEGILAVGERLSVTLHLVGHRPRTLKPKVMAVEPGRAFAWLGNVGVRGLLDGEHRFEVRPVGPDRCELVQSERLSGLLVPAFRSLLTGPTPTSFVRMNEAFQARVERTR